MKKKTKKKIIKGSLCIIASFFLIWLMYLDTYIKKDEGINLISLKENNIFTNVSSEELLDILNEKTGVILIINNRKDINKIVSILTNLNNKEQIYVYNIRNDETILSLDKNNNVVVEKEPTPFYNSLLETLGAYSEEYYLINDKEEYIDTGYKTIYLPIVLFVKDGKILYSYYSYDLDLTDEELKDTYNKGYEILKLNYNSKS